MAERKVVQIAAVYVSGSGLHEPGIDLFALTADGTIQRMWVSFGGDTPVWRQLPPIPQPQGEAAGPGEELLTQAQLEDMMRDPRYWHQRDPKFIARVMAGFRQLYADAPSPAEPVAADDKLDILDRLTGWLLAEEAPLVDGRAAIAEIEEYHAWRQGKIGVEELYTCRHKLQTATAEITRLRARIAELESE